MKYLDGWSGITARCGAGTRQIREKRKERKKKSAGCVGEGPESAKQIQKATKKKKE